MWFRVLCSLIILFHLTQILYFNRSSFLEPYDVSYWKDRYEHSQYVLPLSKRIIGDDGLYAYTGYRLMAGDDPTFMHANKAPLALYLIGMSIVLFQSPAFYALFFGIGSIVVFYFIGRSLLKNTSLALFTTTILFLDPLFFTQLWKPWLDIVHTFFLLVNILFLILLSKGERRYVFALLAGVSLGFFFEVKPPVLFPVIFLAETIYILFKRYVKEYGLYVVGIGLGILIPYIHYFQLGHGILDLARLHKHILGLYMVSEKAVEGSALWQILLSGSSSEGRVGEWWIIWPIILITSLGVCIYMMMHKKDSLLFGMLALILIGSLLTYTKIPFYARYLVVLLPFLYLFSGKAIGMVNNTIFVRIASLGLVLAVGYAWYTLHPVPQDGLRTFSYSFSQQYFQDIYKESLISRDKQQMSQSDFRLIANSTLEKASVRSIVVEEKTSNISRLGNAGSATIVVTYKTQDLGSFSEEKEISMVKEASGWKVKWDWNILLSGYRPGMKVEAKRVTGKRGRILDSKGNILAQDQNGYLISINPEKIDGKRENEMLSLVSQLSSQKAVHLINVYLENVLPDTFVPVATVFIPLDEETKQTLLSYSGLQLVSYPSRIYDGLSPLLIKNTFYDECCSRIYSSYNYHGVAGPELEYDSVVAGYSGGEIVIRDSNGTIVRTILKKDAKNGKDVILPITKQ